MAQLRAQQNELAQRVQALEQQQQPAPAPLGGGFKIEPFGGNPREDVRRWLDRFELLRTANAWPEERARAALALNLVGAAESWLHAQAPDVIDTVEHLAAALRAAFAPVDESLALRDQLMSRRQGSTESVEAYAASVLELCRRLDIQMPARDKCAFLLHGFNAEIKAHLLTTMPGADNVGNLLQAARTREHALLATRPAPAVHAATHERDPIGELSGDVRRVLNRLDSLSDRVGRLEEQARYNRNAGAPPAYYERRPNPNLNSSGRQQNGRDHFDGQRPPSFVNSSRGAPPRQQQPQQQEQRRYQHDPRRDTPAGNGGRRLN